MKIFTKNTKKVIGMLLLSMVLAFTGIAQCVITQTSGFVPAWNGQEFCNGTTGYNPSQIDQPVFSAPCSIASYNYEWQKSYDNSAWIPITTGVGASVVPAFDPLVETNTTATNITLYYRLQVIGNITGGGITLTTFFSNFTFILRPQVIFTGSPFVHITGDVSKITNSFCAGTSVTLKSNNTTPASGSTYQWQRTNPNSAIYGIFQTLPSATTNPFVLTNPTDGNAILPIATDIDNRSLRLAITEPTPTGGGAGCVYTSSNSSQNYVSPNTTYTVTSIPNATPICAGSATAQVNFTDNIAGASNFIYSFSGDNIGQPKSVDTVGAASSPANALPSFTSVNMSTTTKTATVTVTTFVDGNSDGKVDWGECSNSTPVTFDIVVKPIPNAIATAATQNICPSAIPASIALTSAVSGTTYTWTVTNPGGTLSGFTAAGSGSSIAGVSIITATAPKILDSVVYTITPTAVGCAGPTAKAVIYVVDSTKPVITPITDITGNTTTGTCAKTVSAGLNVTATDNCDVAPSISHEVTGATTLGSTSGQLSTLSFNKGVSTVTYTVTDGALNVSTSTFTVTISDMENPVVTAPAATTGTTNVACTSTNVVLGMATATDNCTASSTITNNAPSAFPIGQTIVVWTATDDAGNTDTAHQVVMVTDNINPMITAANDTIVKIQSGCTATVVLNMPTFSDNCILTSTAVTNDHPSTTYPKGITTVTWTVTDQAGLTATDIQIVTVLDTIKPVITVPAATTGTSNVACTSTNVTLGMATATDNCSGVITITNNAPPAFSLGLTVVTWTAEDESGNTIQGFQNVTVTDNIFPSFLTVPAATTGTTNIGCSSTNVSLGLPTVTDNCTLASTAITNNAPAAFPIGVTIVTWTVTDKAGNATTATQMVTVTDNINPMITAPGNISSNTNAGCGAVGLTLGTPTFSDNCTLTGTAVTNNSTGSYALGVTTIIWTVTDQAGNTATATQTVTVIDSIKPLIPAITGTSVNVDAGLCTATYTLVNPSVIENCTLATLTNDHPSATYALGANTVIWTATDAAGNVSTQTEIITVVDNIKPTITAPGTVTFTANASCSITGVTNGMLGTPTGADNCLPPSFSVGNTGTYPLGTTVVIWTATDASGNIATATQNVIVVDLTNPTITAPANITIASNTTSCDKTASLVMLGMPTFNDNCTLTSTAVVNNAPTTVYPLGVTTVTWQVTDGAGNTATAIQTVTVKDSTAPIVICTPFVINLNSTSTGTYSITPGDIMDMTTGSTDNCAITARSISQTTFNCSNQGVNNVILTVTDAAGNSSTCTTTVTVNSSITSVTAVVNSNIACFGSATGNMTVSSVGGSGSGVTYSWTGPQTGSSISLPLQTAYTVGGLLAGTYTITATTSTGCTNTTIVTITQPALALTTTATATPITCNNANDGKITFTYGGGYTDLHVSWSGGTPFTSGSFTTVNNADTFTVTNLGPGSYTINVSDNAPGAPLCSVSATATVVNPPALAATKSATVVNNTCFNGTTGSIDLMTTVTGGTGPITKTYAWTKVSSAYTSTVEDPSGLTAGVYNVTVTIKDSNLCTLVITETATITEPTEIMPTLASTNPLCNGGSTGTITASATGGTGAYTYQLGSGTYQTTGAFTGQAAGTYTVNVKDANGCIKSASVTLINPAIISAITQTGSTTNVNCFGASTGAFVVSATGGTAPLTYSVTGGFSNTSGSFSGLAAGTYAVTATDANGCVKTGLSITVIQPSTALTATLVQTTVVSCNNGSNGSLTANAGISGTASYTYVIAGPTVNTTGASSGIFTGLASGAYTVTVTDTKGCTFTTSSVTLANPSVLTIAQVGTTTNVLCNAAATGAFSVAASGGIGTSFNYTKSPMGGTQATPGVWSALPAGTYTAVATSNLGCVVTATSITITQPTVIVVTATGTNPTCNGFATGQIAASATGGTGTKTFTISGGPTVNTTGASSGTFTGLLAGTYTVTATDANNCTKTTNVTLTNPAVLTFSAAPLVANATCNGTANGSITAIGTGGTPAYTYSLSPTGGTSGSATSGMFGGLAAGSYLIKVTDTKGCLDSSFMTVTQPTMIAVTPSVAITNTLCNGNANGAVVLTVNASGGTPGYTTTYLWSNGATTKDISGLVAGTYTVNITVKDASSGTCQKTFTSAISAVVTNPGILLATSTPTNVLCFGGSTGQIQAATTGGTGTKTYTMVSPASSNTTGLFTGLAGGTYTINVVDANGCTASTTATVNTPTLAVPDVTPTLLTGSTNFITATTARNMVIRATELNGNPAAGFSILISKNTGYTVTLPNVTTMIAGGVYAVTNPQWTLGNYGPAPTLYYQLTFNPGGTVVNCQQSNSVGVIITRGTTDTGLFPITVVIGGVTSETNTSNNSAVKQFTAN